MNGLRPSDLQMTSAESAPGGERIDIPSDDLYRSLVERVREVAIFMLDPLGHVQSWNVGAAQLTGYRRAEILGRHVSFCRRADAWRIHWTTRPRSRTSQGSWFLASPIGA